ncbi:hypothetical protein [Enterocloster bolteae]|uniref:hypothetical protein n=1 Tax=Enterocloster bolteae TaxID=208479 RepID=UPI001F2B6D90|nr:hypothetical protein [Enterocloster bolteae]
MIQELAKYPPDMEIEVNVYKNGYSAMAEVSEDCSEGEESIVEIDIDENTSSIAISDERKSWGSNAQKYVRILAEL